MASSPQLKVLSIDLLVIDADTQARVSISEETVDTYVEVVEESNEWPFPAVDVFHDGSKYYVADGFHRYLAAKRLKRASISCVVHKGTSKDAKIFGMTANDNHGLRMSREDKRACVAWLLEHGGKMTHAEISEKAGVVQRTVRRIVADRKADAENRTMSYSTSKTLGKLADSESKPTNGKSANEPASASLPADPVPPKKVTQAERIKMAKSLIIQHLERAVRGIDDLAEMKPNKSAQNSLIKAIQSVMPKIREW